MKSSNALLAVVLVASAAARAQVAPAIQGPYGLPVSGTLHYDMRYTQTALFYSGNTEQRGVASGEVTYSNTSPVLPFVLEYSGGDSWNISGPSEETGVFQHLMISQGLVRHDWTFRLTDDVSYLPEAPVTGFSGIPGVGNLPGEPGPPNQPILTLDTRSVYNTVSPDFTHTFGHATSMDLGAKYSILRFPDANGLETDSLEGNGQITRRLDARNSIFGHYVYANTSFPEYSALTMDTQSALLGYSRIWNRRLRMSISAGPEWVQSSDDLLVPPSTNLTVDVNANYELRSTSAAVSYNRATTGSAGEASEVGIRNDDVSGSVSQKFGRNLTVSATGAYMHTAGLALLSPPVNVATNGESGGVIATRRLSRYFTIFANYTVVEQSSSYGLTANVFNGLSQVVGFGVAYSPLDIKLKK